jgi:uncharacterized membrane protein
VTIGASGLLSGPRRTGTKAGGGLRGGGFFMFLSVLLPITLIAIALVADYSRAILAGRQMTNTADIVAMAAATSFNETGTGTTTTLDPETARARAAEMVGRAEASGMIPRQYEAEITGVAFSDNNRTVSITIEYQIPDFFIVGFFSGDEGLRSAGGRVTRSATICLPDDPERIDGAGCAYPLG